MVSVQDYWQERQRYLDATLYCLKHNCTLAEAQQALFGKILFDWED